MTDYLNVYDLNRQKSAVLQNAFEIKETQELNKIYTLDFKIPADDPKIQFLQPFHYVRYGDTGQLYRIIKSELEDSDTPILSVNCEHVIATLCDAIMFGSYDTAQYVDNLTTRSTIEWLLSKQQDWTLDVCEFNRKFEYLWEQENILNALYSIPKEFTKAYKWAFDTSGYPWKLSLKAIDTTIHPEYYIRAKRNLLSSGTAQDFAGICTRIYPLGYGEGVNQLTIKEATVKNIKKVGNVNVSADVDESGSTKYGNTYIQSDAAIVAQYGIKEKVLVDRRFEDANSLFSYGKTMLEGLQTPSMSRSFDVVDLYPLTSQNIDNAEVGKICKMTGDDTIAYITKTERVLDEAGNLTIELSTKATDVVNTIADLADRVRIESVYAQGATQLYQHSKDANATPTKGMIMSLYFPSEMRQINKVLMRLKLNKFRSYSQTTESNGGYSQTLSVAEASKEITSQTNTGNESINVTASSITTTSQTNTGNESVTVKTQENIVTVGMDAEADQSLTTTKGGGGSGTTSATIGDNTIDINATTATAWDNDNKYSSTDSTPNGSVEVAGVNEKHYGSTYSYSVDGYHTHNYYGGTGQDAIDGGSHNHNVSVEVPYKNKEVINNDPYTSSDNGKKHIHTISLNGFTHKHDINLSKIGNHSHSFEVDDHTHEINIGHTHKVTVPAQTLSVPCPKHTHGFTVPAQTLKVSCPAHKHQITIPAWSKTINIPPHKHGIEAGIYESGNPTSFTIKVSGTTRAIINATSYNNDIVTWLLDDKNQVPRDSWIDVEIIPNDLAYCQCSVFVQGFVQSRGGGNF